MFAKMGNNPPISADELQIECNRFKEVFRGDNSFAKFDASAEMMVLISRYLSDAVTNMEMRESEKRAMRSSRFSWFHAPCPRILD